MKRRDFVKGFAVATATATATTALGQPVSPEPPPQSPSTTAAPARPVSRAEAMARFRTPNIPLSQPDLIGVTDQRYFTPARYAALVHLCEIFMPATDENPSAIKAGTPEFLDFYIGASPADKQALYNTGLDKLNADSLRQFKVTFDKTDEKQADALIKPYLKGWMNDHPPKAGHERFVTLALHDIRQVTIASPAWAAAAEASGERAGGVGLYWNPIEPTVQTWLPPHPAAAPATASVVKKS